MRRQLVCSIGVYLQKHFNTTNISSFKVGHMKMFIRCRSDAGVPLTELKWSLETMKGEFSLSGTLAAYLAYLPGKAEDSLAQQQPSQ